MRGSSSRNVFPSFLADGYKQIFVKMSVNS